MEHHDYHHQQQHGGANMTISSSSGSSDLNDEETMMNNMEELRRGPWTVEEDFALINYIAHHGEGRWNSLARCAGLKRTGKSCRLRWLNYLRPDVRRGNITLQEQLLILELHSRWGNRWSKIAQHLPGRTDNEIKNYWRTRVQKHAKQLKCDVNSKQFKDTMRYLWMPRLVERIQAAAANSNPAPTPPQMPSSDDHNIIDGPAHHQILLPPQQQPNIGGGGVIAVQTNYTPENSSAAASSESFGTPASDLTECYNNYPVINQQGHNNNNNNNNQDYYSPAAAAAADRHDQLITYNSNYGDGDHHHQYYSSLISPTAGGGYSLNQIGGGGGLDYMTTEQNSQYSWVDGGDAFCDDLWNVDDMWLSHHQFNSNYNI